MTGHRNGRQRILLVATAGNFSQLGARLLISPLVPAIMVAFSVSKSRVGLVLTGMWAIYALFQYPGGTLGDIFDERRILLLSLGLTAVATFLLAWAPSFLLFGVFVLFLGSGAGLYFPVASSMLTKRFERTGQALSLLTGGGSIAGLIYPALAGYLVIWIGWRRTLALGGGVALVVFVLALGLTDSPPTRSRRAAEWFSVGRVIEILTTPGVAYTVGLAVAFGFTWQGIASFFPTFLYEYRQLSTGGAGVAFGVLYLLSSLAQPFVGRLSDALDRDAALFVSASLTATGLGLLLFTGSLFGLVAGVGILGVGISWPGVIQARIMDHFEDDERGRGFGLVRAVYMLLGSLGSVVVGSLADFVGWPVAYGFVIGLLSLVVAALAVNRLFEVGL